MSEGIDPLGDALKGQSDAERAAADAVDPEKKKMFLRQAAACAAIVTLILASLAPH